MSMSDSEVREALLSVAATTQNEAVRRVMRRAVEMLDEGRLDHATADVLDEMAKTKQAERRMLLVGPLAALMAAVLLFLALMRF